ncbi:uncharacterized protein LTHEOB_4061 [Lasiodiplodia theobromae]|uniref:uncharacterized protein n=1 Tax=Lasiodiplodia theobromae TaxID=45133 RepID=UPI0015C2CC20|nr:uncharacterized protein LTHEOB_4061 [Lasiodiplodia theobromae]KAF4546753.1 hypothetical protein LTHEOB_4061 [Lasiodiplodia theobromae]
MRTTPLLSVASERLAEQSPTGNKYLDVLMAAYPIEQEPSSITHNSPTIGSVEAANLGRDSATPIAVDPNLQEGADPYTGSIDSAIGDKSSPINSMPRDIRNKVEGIVDEEGKETAEPPEGIRDASQDDGETGPAEIKYTVANALLVYSSDRLGRLRPRGSLPTPKYTSLSRRPPTSTTSRPPRTPKTPKTPLEEDGNKPVGRQTREFDKYLESIPLRKDFYVKKEDDPKPLSNKAVQLPASEPLLNNDSRGRSQSVLPGKSQDDEMNNGKNRIKMEETPESRVRYEVYGRPVQPPPIGPTELYRRRKNDGSQMHSNPTRAAAFGSTTNTPPASSGPAAAGFRAQGESASSYIRTRPFSGRDDEDSQSRRNVNRLAESLLSNDDVFQNNAARAGAMPPPLYPPRRSNRGRGNSDNVQTQPKRRRLNPENDDQPPSTNTTSYRPHGSRGTSTSRQSRNNSTSQGPPVTTFPSLQVSNPLAAAAFVDSAVAPANSRPPQQEQQPHQQHQQYQQEQQQLEQHQQPRQFRFQPSQDPQNQSPYQQQQQKEQK